MLQREMPAKAQQELRGLLAWGAPWRIRENHYSLPIKLLKTSADTRNLNLGKIIHAHLLISNKASENHVIENNTLLNLYTKCAQLSVAQQVFDGMRVRNIVSWGTLIGGYFHGGFCSKVLELLKAMIKVDKENPDTKLQLNKYVLSMELNKYVLSMVLSCCAKNGLLSEGKQCHTYALKSGFIFHQYVKNAILSLYCLCADLDGAVMVFDGVPGSDIYTYNSMLGGFLEHAYFIEAVDVLFRLANDSIDWDGVSYVSCFCLSARLKDLKLGLSIHAKLLKSFLSRDAFVNSAIIDMYGKCSNISMAKKVFDSSEPENVVSWTAIMAAYLQNEYFEEVLNMFLNMKLDGVRPNEYTYSVLLNSCSNLSAIGYGSSLHSDIMKMGYDEHVTVGNALVNMYSKCCDIEAASVVFSRLRFRDCVTWNAMISGYAHHGLGEKALSTFQCMSAGDTPPNYVTFIGVLSACGHLGQVEEGFHYLEYMTENMGIEPGLEHFTCIIGLLGKTGKLKEAINFMESTSINWDIVAWRTLLNACHVHRDYVVGMQAANIIAQMNHDDVGTCILLSNMQAKAKMWHEAAKTRRLLKERNIKKEPGLSWTEIRNNTHAFVSNDEQHSETVQIREKVRELLAEVKPLGYVPDTASAMHDVEEEQIEDDLSYHSEKLAIAYALMKTPPNAPIRVIKNLRMCDDCHSAAKLISLVTNRTIIVRDANRFHSFRNGCCSCVDYW